MLKGLKISITITLYYLVLYSIKISKIIIVYFNNSDKLYSAKILSSCLYYSANSIKITEIFKIIMNILDVILIVIFIFYAFRGYRRGLIYEIFSIGIIIIGLLASFLFFKKLSVLFNQFLNNKDLSLVIAFLAIFIGVSISLITMRNILSNLIESLNLTEIDSILGLVVAVIKIILLISIVLMFIESHSILGLDKIIGRSFIYSYIKRIFLAFMSILPAKIRMVVFSIF